MTATLSPFGLSGEIGTLASHKPSPQVRTIGIHQDLPEAEMAGHLPEGLQAHGADGGQMPQGLLELEVAGGHADGEEAGLAGRRAKMAKGHLRALGRCGWII